MILVKSTGVAAAPPAIRWTLRSPPRLR